MMRCDKIIGGLMLATSLFFAGAALAAGDAAAGKAIFGKTCQNCHSVDVGVNKVGPSLYGIIGRQAGVVQGFEYSDALKNSGKTWTVEELGLYLSNPRSTLHGVKMDFKGLQSDSDRADVIAYLQSLQD
jgi:cytochrome c